MSETNYGVIADRLAWEMPLNATATIESPPFQIFTTTAPEESEHALRVRPLRALDGAVALRPRLRRRRRRGRPPRPR